MSETREIKSRNGTQQMGTPARLLGLLLIALLLLLAYRWREAPRALLRRPLTVDASPELKATLDRARGAFYAHRGLSFFAPENSMLAIELARQRGFQKVEIDVAATADNQHVVFHDLSLERAFGRNVPVCKMTAAELQALPLGDHFLREAFSLTDEAIALVRSAKDPWVDRIYAERIATLDDVFSRFGTSLHYHLDTKSFSCGDDPTPMLRALVEILTRHGLLEVTVVESTDLDLLRRLKAIESRIQALYWNNDIFSWTPEALSSLTEAGISRIDLYYKRIDPKKLPLFEPFALHTYTPNTAAEIAVLLEQVDFIITDLDLLADSPRDQYQFFNEQSSRVRIQPDPSSPVSLVE